MMNKTPIKFYPYAHSVMDWVYSQEYNSNDSIDNFRKRLDSIFKEHGIKTHIDNKIVYEVHIKKTNVRVFYGFYDWVFSIGLAVRKIC